MIASSLRPFPAFHYQIYLPPNSLSEQCTTAVTSNETHGYLASDNMYVFYFVPKFSTECVQLVDDGHDKNGGLYTWMRKI